MRRTSEGSMRLALLLSLLLAMPASALTIQIDSVSLGLATPPTPRTT
jgi:hypothetical protein